MEKIKKTEDIKAYMAEYRKKHRVGCECGGSYNKYTKPKHELSGKHTGKPK